MKSLQGARYATDSDEFQSFEQRGMLESARIVSREKLPAELFSEYKKQFEARNFSRIEKVIVEFETRFPESPILNAIKGEQFLYHGNSEKSHHCLSNYLMQAKQLDPYVLGVIAMWNDAAGFCREAFTQFVERLRFTRDPGSTAWYLFHAITNKKRCKFLDTALQYYERLISVPEGYRLLRCVKIEMAHIYLLKKNYSAASSILSQCSKFRPCIFTVRLEVYIHYTEHNYSEIMKHKGDTPMDPYIAYIIGRVGMENPETEYDIPYFFNEAIKYGGNLAHVHNSYGNYYYKLGRYSDATEQYENALRLDSNFQPSRENLALIAKTSLGSNGILFADNHGRRPAEAYCMESDPDVEEMGFLNISAMFGYRKFKKTLSSVESYSPLVTFFPSC